MIFDTLKYIFYFSLLLAAPVVGGVKFRKLSAPFKWLTIYVAFVLAAECVSMFFKYSLGKSNIIVYHFQLPVMILLHGVVFFKVFEAFGKGGWKWMVAPILASAISVIISLSIQTTDMFPSYSILLSSLILEIYCLFVLLYIIESSIETTHLKRPIFWFAAGTLIFYCATFIFFGLYPVFIKSGRTAWMHHLNFVVNIILYSSYLAAIVLDAKQNEENEFALD